jgi:methyltransferase (TIGR00027 family)
MQDEHAELPSGVGLTAVGVAYIRAAETQRDDRLFDDPLAEEFVHASGWTIPPDSAEAVESQRGYWAMLQHWVIVRTRFLDELVLEAARDGCGQVVLLGAGLDARAYRLGWPEGVRLFEIDVPEVLDFKEHVLRRCNAEPRCARTTVRADLLEDWRTPLQASGFRSSETAVWVAEGLLIYLTTEQNDRLLSEVTELSAGGSAIGITLRTHVDEEPVADRSMTSSGRQPTFRTMWKSRAPDDPTAWLEGHGWQPEIFHARERGDAYGRPVPDPEYQQTSLLVRATRLG